MNKKKLKLIFLTSIFLVLITCVTSIYFFSQRDNNNNFIAIVEVRLSKSIDHIFLDTTADNVIIEYATRTLRNNLTDYKWEFNTSNKIEAKLFIKDKKTFYQNDLPKLKQGIKDTIPKLNKGIKHSFEDFFLDNTTQNLFSEGQTDNTLFYWRLATKAFYTDDIRLKVRFKKHQLTDFEYIALSLFISAALLTFIIVFYFSFRRKEIKT